MSHCITKQITVFQHPKFPKTKIYKLSSPTIPQITNQLPNNPTLLPPKSQQTNNFQIYFLFTKLSYYNIDKNSKNITKKPQIF